MPLKQDELTEALHDGLKAAAVCSNTFCRATAEVDGEGYRLAHNGTGNRDTDVQFIRATPILNLNKDALATKIGAWVKGLHTGERTDLNATMELRGPSMTGWPWRVADHFGHVRNGA